MSDNDCCAVEILCGEIRKRMKEIQSDLNTCKTENRLVPLVDKAPLPLRI